MLFNCATGLKYPMPKATKKLDKSAKVGIYHKNTVGRKKSAIAKLVNGLSAAPARAQRGLAIRLLGPVVADPVRLDWPRAVLREGVLVPSSGSTDGAQAQDQLLSRR